jgi:GNAT superfamily N-acetyltransferase
MTKEFVVKGPVYEQSGMVAPIMRNLPDWFGVEESLNRYIAEIDQLPTFMVLYNGAPAGFLVIKVNTPYAAEVYVMGVRAELQRRGMGRALLEHAQTWLQKEQVEYLQVKTLGPSRPDECYESTRDFYLAMGFRPLEELKQIWNEDNPCLILIKRI